MQKQENEPDAKASDSGNPSDYGDGSPEPDKPVEPDDPFGDADSTDAEAWRQFPMPFGKNAGIALEELDKKYLYGLWANYEVEEEYNGKRKSDEQIEKDTLFRAMLDLAGEHHHFTKK